MAFSSGEFEISKLHGEEEEGLRLGLVRLTRGLGRKRILISKSHSDQSPVIHSPPVNIPLKRSKSETTSEANCSVLESLHQDILIRVLCHVDHDDLVRLKLVSKTIRKAVIQAKKSHFDYSTPKKSMPFRDALLIQDSNSSDGDDDIEPPNAPIRRRNVNRESDLSKISMVLFK